MLACVTSDCVCEWIGVYVFVLSTAINLQKIFIYYFPLKPFWRKLSHYVQFTLLTLQMCLSGDCKMDSVRSNLYLTVEFIKIMNKRKTLIQ